MNSASSVTETAGRFDSGPSLPGLLAREFAAELRNAMRQPAFAIPTLVMPLAFYSLFAVMLATPGSGTAGYMLATYGVFAALGPAMFGFGASIAAQRENGTLALKRIAPLPPGVHLAARLLTCMVFTLLVVLALYAVAAIGGGVRLPRTNWLALSGVHLLSVVPLCLLGLCIGLRFTSSAAMAVSNIAFMALAVLGGLWIPIGVFPHWLQQAAQILPTYHLGALALIAAGRSTTEPSLPHWLALLAFTAIAAVLAQRLWARDAS